MIFRTVSPLVSVWAPSGRAVGFGHRAHYDHVRSTLESRTPDIPWSQGRVHGLCVSMRACNNNTHVVYRMRMHNNTLFINIKISWRGGFYLRNRSISLLTVWTKSLRRVTVKSSKSGSTFMALRMNVPGGKMFLCGWYREKLRVSVS